MDYGIVETGKFIKRFNRFSALVEVCGAQEICHVKNTGRLGELLLPGAEVYLKYCAEATRKTRWDLISVKSHGQVVNIDSQAPNKVFREYLNFGKFRKDICVIKPEFTYGDSRFDFCLECEKNIQFVEVKGVTLLRNGHAYFPDAPTERGIKHLRGLIRAVEAGYEAAVAFVIQMKKVDAFSPNDDTQPLFAQTLREAVAAGVTIHAYDCLVTENTLLVDCEVPVQL